MTAIDQLVQIQITNATVAVAQQSFSIPLIMGPTNPGWSERLRTYSSPAAMLTDGYTISSPEYIYASAMAGQSIAPSVFKVGRRTAGASQVDIINVPGFVALSGSSSFTVNGNLITASSSTTQQSLLGTFATALTALSSLVTSAVVTGTGTSAVLTVTYVGGAVYTAVDAKIAVTNSTPGGGLAGDLALAAAQDNTWYGVCCAGATDSDILNAAVWVEANKKLMVQSSATSAIAASGTSDVLSVLQASGYKRTAILYNPAGVTQGGDAAWLGSQLAQTPGANTWAYKTLAGVTADTLSDSARSNIIGVPTAGLTGKQGNIYTNVGGANITQMGMTASGQFIDITVGLDWLQAQLQTNLYSVLVNSSKVPYTDVGVTLLINQVKSAIDLGARNGLIDPASPITITAAKVSTVPQNQRAQRIAPTIYFTCRLQGALHAVLVKGTVTV